MRRWISAARRTSISCSVTAQASASQGHGRRRGRSQGRWWMASPISGSPRKVRANSESGRRRRRARSASARSRARAPRAARDRPGRRRPRGRRPAALGLPGVDDDATVRGRQQPGDDRAAAPGDAVAAEPTAQPVRPRRAHLDLERRDAAATAAAFRYLSSRWTSTRKERLATTFTGRSRPRCERFDGRSRATAGGAGDGHRRRSGDQAPGGGERRGPHLALPRGQLGALVDPSPEAGARSARRRRLRASGISIASVSSSSPIRPSYSTDLSSGAFSSARS